jgi:hypothetical protein
MENQQLSDILFGIFALIIVIGGLLMLFQGVSSMNDKK